MSVRILANLRTKPGCAAQFIEAFKPMCATSNQEAGCKEYTLCQDQKDENSFWVVEKYDNNAAIDAHMASTHFKELGPKIGSLLDGAPVMHQINIVV